MNTGLVSECLCFIESDDFDQVRRSVSLVLVSRCNRKRRENLSRKVKNLSGEAGRGDGRRCGPGCSEVQNLAGFLALEAAQLRTRCSLRRSAAEGKRRRRCALPAHFQSLAEVRCLFVVLCHSRGRHRAMNNPSRWREGFLQKSEIIFHGANPAGPIAAGWKTGGTYRRLSSRRVCSLAG